MTQTKYTLDLDTAAKRYEGMPLSFQWQQILADEAAQLLANHFAAELGDVENCHPDLLPLYAWETNSIAWTDLFGIREERNSVAVAQRMNEVMGSEEAWYIFAQAYGGDGSITYTEQGGIPTGVDLYISPPRGFDVTPQFIAHVIRVARAGMVPYYLRLIDVHILNRGVGAVNYSGAYTHFDSEVFGIIDLRGN